MCSRTIGNGKIALEKCEGPCTLMWYGSGKSAQTCRDHGTIITNYETVMEASAESLQVKATLSTTGSVARVYTSSELQGIFDPPAPWAAKEIGTNVPYAESWRTMQVTDAQLKGLGGKLGEASCKSWPVHCRMLHLWVQRS